jgi:plastocyanin
MTTLRLLRLLPVATIGLLAACGDATGPATPHNKTVDVFTIGDSFSPTFATIDAGDTVRWNFSGGSDGMGHNVRFTPRITGAPADINVLKTGTASRVFTTAGEFNYVCDVHPGMSGDVQVR